MDGSEELFASQFRPKVDNWRVGQPQAVVDGLGQDIDLIPHLVPPTGKTDASATLNTYETGLATTNEQSDGIAGM
ncbi:hypothetical protein [Pseudomonas sp. ME-P-057]|uniref:hypothetical protein n=1 Tax=Pseudomonas sp. ME-P-057 TaxID=3040321 RepID=UPI00255219E9|nr:hypothetical protein [Pseudomonas sp. ME-P-057]